MWLILNINIKKINFFKKELSKKIGNDFNIYFPKIKISNNKNLKNKIVSLLGNYIFCYHPKFDSKLFVNNIKYVKGLNYLLFEYKFNQEEIQNFILHCKKNEDQEGFLLQNFIKINLNEFYQFKTGLFKNRIFKLIDIQKNKIQILIENLKLEVKKKNLLIFSNN